MANEDARPILVGGEQLREEVDRAAGGGPKYHPFTFAEAVRRLGPEVASVATESRAIPEPLRGARVYFEATLLPNYLAASYFPAPLLETTGLHAVGSRKTTGTLRTRANVAERPTKTLILTGTRDEISELQRVFEQPENALARAVRESVLVFSEVALPREERVMRPVEAPTQALREVPVWEAVLHRVWGDTGRAVEREQEQIFEKWVAFVEGLDGEVVRRYRRLVDGLTFVPVRIPAERAAELAQFNPLRVMRPMPQLRPITPEPLRMVGGVSTASLPAGTLPRTTERVAVFDGGVDPTCPLIAPFVTHHELTGEPAVQEGVHHGSAVTNAILYGHHDDASQVDVPNVLIDHFRILPVPAAEGGDLELNWILDRIVENVEREGHRWVNLSLGPELCVEDDGEPSRWTAELDRLAHERGVLFVCAAGNNGLNAPDLDRVQVPGDMANGLTVGAADTFTSASTFKKATYSAKGPGRWGARVQPLGVCFGGEVGGDPFVALGPGGQRYATCGTSFAAPLALHGLTDLVARMGTDHVRDPHFMRGVAAHFAHRRKTQHDVTEVGFGLLRHDYVPVLDCGPNQVTVIYQDVLQRDSVSGFTFPVPTGLDPDARITIRWTLCYSSPVDSAEALDYTKAGVVATFRPHMRRIPVNFPSGTRVQVFDYVEQQDEFEAAIDAGGTPAANPATDQGREIRVDEQRQRDAGKWETLLHHRFSRKAGDLFFPRLDLSYFVREGGALVGPEDADDLPITLIVTVEGPAGSQLYESVRQQFNVLVPVEVEVAP